MELKLSMTKREKKLLTLLSAYMGDAAQDLKEDGDSDQRKRGAEYAEAVEVLDRLIKLASNVELTGSPKRSFGESSDRRERG